METLNYYLTNYKALIIGFCLLILLIIFWAWFSAESEINLPRADEHNSNSGTALAASQNLRREADDFAASAEALEKPKRAAVKKAAKSREEFQKSSEKLQKNVNEYEKFQNTPVVVSSDDLDRRERELLSNLRKLYPKRKR